MADLDTYLGLITSEHRDKPRYALVISALLQGHVDNQAVLASLETLFDLDTAVGAQLDIVGQWIGPTRFVSGIGELDDFHYRLLLRARVLNNHWDGSIPNAYAIWDRVFAGTDYLIYIFDYGNLTMDLGLVTTGAPIDATTAALFTGGYLNIKPAGVRINAYLIPSIGGPFFGLNRDDSFISGLNVGKWYEI